MTLGYKTYRYKIKDGPVREYYFLTLNGSQIGGIMFSLREVNEKIEAVKKGEPLHANPKSQNLS